MNERPRSGFTKHFLWGAATGAHHIEGGLHNQWTVWELENARTLAVQAEYHYGDFPSWERIKGEAKSPSNYVSGAATDHVHRYKEDFDLLQKMNMNAYRFSIEWSRIEPEEGSWNPEAIAYYKKYLKELKRRDIEPVVTLLHFTLPVWFAEKGGFEHRSNVKYFVRYVEKIMTELGNDMKWIITINKPEVYTALGYIAQMWPSGQRSVWKRLKVAGNLARAHNRAAKLIHKTSRKFKVSIAKQSMYVYAGDNAWLSRLSAHVLQYVQDDYFLKKVVKNCDFLGVNYYMSMRVYGYRIHNPESPLSDVNWVMAPADIELVLERLHVKYKLPIMITENGVADGLDEHRQWWIKETIVGMQAAMKRGVRLLGYFHWTLTDNFEWEFGRWPRFGLAAVDFKTGKRTLRKSAVWFGGVIRKLRGI
jgi:beta-glucosidase